MEETAKRTIEGDTERKKEGKGDKALLTYNSGNLVSYKLSLFLTELFFQSHYSGSCNCWLDYVWRHQGYFE